MSKTNENLKLLNPSNGYLHYNYNTATTEGEDSRTNACQLNEYNLVYGKNSRCFSLIKSNPLCCLTTQLILLSRSTFLSFPWAQAHKLDIIIQ